MIASIEVVGNNDSMNDLFENAIAGAEKVGESMSLDFDVLSTDLRSHTTIVSDQGQLWQRIWFLFPEIKKT